MGTVMNFPGMGDKPQGNRPPTQVPDSHVAFRPETWPKAYLRLSKRSQDGEWSFGILSYLPGDTYVWAPDHVVYENIRLADPRLVFIRDNRLVKGLLQRGWTVDEQ